MRQEILDLIECPNTVRRPRRAVPSLLRLAEYWELGREARCVRCDIGPAPGLTWQGWDKQTWKGASGIIERAHIIDRWAGGLDIACNVAPLCSRCHALQPIFVPGDEIAALEWFGLANVAARIKERASR